MADVKSLRGSVPFLIFLGGMVALSPLSIDAYLPAIPTMAEYFGVNIVAVNLTMTTYLLGNALGQFLGGALSDHWGRRRLGLGGLAIFLVASVLIIFAHHIGQVQLLRAVQAFGAGTASVVCMAQVRDIYPVEEVPRRLASVILVMLLAPMIAPIIGALLLQIGWKSIFGFLALYAASYLFIYFRKVPETLVENRPGLSVRSLFGGYVAVLTQRVNGRLLPLRYCLFAACKGGIFMSFLTNASFIYMAHFGLNEFQFALAFGANGLVLMAGNRLAVRLMGKIPPQRILPHANLLQLLFIAVALLALLAGSNNFWLLFGCLLGTIAMNGVISPTANGVYLGFFTQHIGSAASLSATMVFFVGSLIGALAAVLAQGSLTPVFTVMLGAGLLGRMVFPRAD